MAGTIAILALLTLMPVVANEKLTVWIEAATDEDDWPIKAFEDSAKDIRKKIKGKVWELSGDKDSADVQIVVTNRYIDGTSETAIRNDVLLGPVVYEPETMIVEAVALLRNGKLKAFRSGKYCTMGVCEWPGTWRRAADSLRKDIERWMKDNRDRVLALREQP